MYLVYAFKFKKMLNIRMHKQMQMNAIFTAPQMCSTVTYKHTGCHNMPTSVDFLCDLWSKNDFGHGGTLPNVITR